MKTKELSFRIMLRPEPEGGHTVVVPSLPGCVTYGETVEEAREMAKDAVEATLRVWNSMERNCLTTQTPSKVC